MIDSFILMHCSIKKKKQVVKPTYWTALCRDNGTLEVSSHMGVVARKPGIEVISVCCPVVTFYKPGHVVQRIASLSADQGIVC